MSTETLDRSLIEGNTVAEILGKFTSIMDNIQKIIIKNEVDNDVLKQIDWIKANSARVREIANSLGDDESAGEMVRHIGEMYQDDSSLIGMEIEDLPVDLQIQFHNLADVIVERLK